MKTRIQPVLYSIVLILFTLACGLENIQVVDSPDLAATITAQALLIQGGGQPQDPTQQVIVITATSEGVPSEEQVVPAEILPPATGDVTVTVTTATNCRTGPGQAFSIVYGMPVGQVAKVVAKNIYSGYWIIEIPGQAGKTCWLWGQYATVTGDTSKLTDIVTPTGSAPTKTNTPRPTATATATSAPVIPNAPSGLIANISCAPGPGANQTTVSGNMSWVDNATNEILYQVSVYGFSSQQLAANSTSGSFSVVKDNTYLQANAPGGKFTVDVSACSDNTSGSCGLSATVQVTASGCP